MSPFVSLLICVNGILFKQKIKWQSVLLNKFARNWVGPLASLFTESMSVLQFILGKPMNPYKGTTCCLDLGHNRGLFN